MPANTWFPALSAGSLSVAFQPSSGACQAGHGEDVALRVQASAVAAQIRAQVVLGEIVAQRLALAVVGRREVAVALRRREALLRVLDEVVLAARVDAGERHSAALVDEVAHGDDRPVRLEVGHARRRRLRGVTLSLPVYQMTPS